MAGKLNGVIPAVTPEKGRKIRKVKIILEFFTAVRKLSHQVEACRSTYPYL